MGLAIPSFVRIRVSILLRNQAGLVCLVRHKKADRRYWLLPGGGQEPFEPMEETAKRELEEEIRVKVSALNFIAIRESISREENRHIQFPIFQGIKPDFSCMATGDDPRIEGIDFFHPDELREISIFPNFGNDLIKLAKGESIHLFKTLEWLP